MVTYGALWQNLRGRPGCSGGVPLLGPLQVQRETATPTHTGLSLPNKGSKFSREPLWALPGLRSLAGVGGQPGFRLWAGGGSGECAQTPHTGKRPARPGTNTGNNALPHKKRGAKLSGPSSRALPNLGPASFLRAAPPRALWALPVGMAAAPASAPHREAGQYTEPAATAATGPSKPCCGSCYSGRLEWMLWHRRAVFTSL